jgi:hypothetical protein
MQVRVLVFSAILLISANGFSQNCVMKCPDNIVIAAKPGQEGTEVSFPELNQLGGCGTLTYSRASGSFFRLGSHSIIVMSSTGAKCSFTVTVTDNEAPNISEITLSRNVLWPANNKLKKLNVYYTVSDISEEVKSTLTVSSNATDGIKDWEMGDDHHIRLKASRLPDGSPRIYTITVSAVDEAGNKSTKSTTIAVSQTMLARPAN